MTCGKILTTAVACVICANIATAEDNGKTMTMSRGVICDTLPQIVEVLDKMTETGDARHSVNSTEGCGTLRGAVPATVYELPPYENERFIVGLIRIEFHRVLGTQYGYAAFKTKDEPVEQTAL